MFFFLLRPHQEHFIHAVFFELPFCTATALLFAGVIAGLCWVTLCSPSTCSLLVRRQHKNFSRHRAHFPCLLLDIGVVAAGTPALSSLLWSSGRHDRRQKSHKPDANKGFCSLNVCVLVLCFRHVISVVVAYLKVVLLFIYFHLYTHPITPICTQSKETQMRNITSIQYIFLNIYIEWIHVFNDAFLCYV